MKPTQVFDYIIVGAGSAGCVLANRLSANPQNRVLLLETGPNDRSLFIHMPAAFSFPLANDKYNWFYHTEPEPHMDNRRMYCPRGRVLGGSSSINGMIYIRGNAMDYEGWEQAGAKGWSYRDVLPYFKKAETRVKGGDDWRGHNGPLKVSTGACENPLFHAFMQAGQEAGYAYAEDVNGYRQEGIGPMDMTVYGGERWSAAKGYLYPIRERENLTITLNARVHRVLFSGRKAIGVEYALNDEIIHAEANAKVILCGGAINSPQLLMLSGIGNADHLRDHNIPLVAHLPGVGENLQDHLEVYVQYSCTKPVSIYPVLKPLPKLKIGIEWLLNRSGLGASNQFEAGGFIRSRAGIPYPDLQYHFLPIAVNYDGRSPAGGHGFQAHIGPMLPTSRGHIRLRSARPWDAPSILFNYTATGEDRRVMRDGIRHTREIIAQKAFDQFRGDELMPGSSCQNDTEIDAFVRQHGESAYHPSCTCKMGVDEMAVVDPSTRVHGVENLHVVDASIMPNITNGNLNAPTIMIAEKTADMILGQTHLPPSTADYYTAENYQHTQR